MKRLFSVLLIVMITFVCSITAFATVVTTYDVWTLEKYNGDREWKIKSCSSANSNVEILSSYATIKVTYTDAYAFANNDTMQTLVVPEGNVGFGKYCFTNCSALRSVTLPSTVTSISEGTFSGTSLLKTINLENTRISSVYSYTFLSSGIESISFPDSCNTIKDNAFLQCENLAAAYIPPTVTEIGTDAFKGCDNLVIYAAGDSYAIEYAIANGIDYVITDAPVEVTYMVGDADGDGAVSILDATKIQRVLVELDDDPDGLIALRADSDGDGLNILDATRIQRYLADFVVDSPIGEYTTASVPVI